MAVEDTLESLMPDLVKATEDGLLKWEESAEAGKFLTSFPDWTISVSISTTKGESEASVELLNKDGQMVDCHQDEGGWPRRLLRAALCSARNAAQGVHEIRANIAFRMTGGEPPD